MERETYHLPKRDFALRRFGAKTHKEGWVDVDLNGHLFHPWSLCGVDGGVNTKAGFLLRAAPSY